MFSFAATTHPMRMPGACRPLVAAPTTKRFDLSISPAYRNALSGGSWKSS